MGFLRNIFSRRNSNVAVVYQDSRKTERSWRCCVEDENGNRVFNHAGPSTYREIATRRAESTGYKVDVRE